MHTKLNLQKSLFKKTEKNLLSTNSGLDVEVFKYDTGIEAIKLKNQFGYITVLPYMGQMIWDVNFHNKSLVMENMYSRPQPAKTIIETYGCFMFHAGLLRNGCPAPEDEHPLHGEFPCANMDKAWLELGQDEKGEFVEIYSKYEYVMGFGDHYKAIPSVRLYHNSCVFDINLRVTNLASVDMELMYMAHMNYAYVPNATFIDAVDLSNKNIRTTVPAHVPGNPQWMEFLKQADNDITILDTLNEPEKYNPEIVLFMSNLKTDQNGNTHMMMKHPDGNAFYATYNSVDLPHTTRWILHNADQKVGAFCLPATCQPEGYLAEKEKGNVQIIASQETRVFSLSTGYLPSEDATKMETLIKSL